MFASLCVALSPCRCVCVWFGHTGSQCAGCDETTMTQLMPPHADARQFAYICTRPGQAGGRGACCSQRGATS